MLGLELSEDQWQEINYVETLLNVASALMPIGPPTYMAEIAPGNEKYLASALYSLSRLGWLLTGKGCVCIMLTSQH